MVQGAKIERPQKKISAEFFQTEGGREPVREWLKALDKDDRQEIAKDIRKTEYGWPIGMPTCDAMGGGIWEVRTNLGNRISRVFFGVVESRMLLLHGIIKKSRKTPPQELETARKRLRNAEARLRQRDRTERN